MKFFNVKRIMLKSLMVLSFFFTLSTVNVACTFWSYQPKLPQAFEQYKHFKNDND